MNYNAVDILLAEDSAADAELTIRALRKGGLTNEIIHVKDGVEALDFLFRRGEFASRDGNVHPKVILLDLKMPRLSGMDVLMQIKSDDVLKVIPVVILTSSKEDPDIKQAYAYGANSYIVKPVDSDNFFKAIREVGFYWLITNERA